jgi:hypothetical protein
MCISSGVWPQLEAYLSIRSPQSNSPLCYREGVGLEPDPTNCVPCFKEIQGHPLDPANLSSAYLWVVEDGGNASDGGVLVWHNVGQRSTYRLRHLASGLYLSRSADPECPLSLTRSCDDQLSAFSLHQPRGKHQTRVCLEDGDLNLLLGSAAVHGDNGSAQGVLWVHGQTAEDKTAAPQPGESLDASAMHTHSVRLAKSSSGKDSLRLYVADAQDVSDAERVSSTLVVVKEYLFLVDAECKAAAMAKRPPVPLGPESVAFFAKLLDETRAFIDPGVQSGDESLDDATLRQPHRQQLARELHLIDALFWALAWPFRPGCYDVHRPDTIGAGIRQVQVQLARVIQSLCVGHKANQLYIASGVFTASSVFPELRSGVGGVGGVGVELAPAGMPAQLLAKGPTGGGGVDSWLQEMTKQLGNGFETSTVMTTLVQNNQEVLVRHVDQALVETFIRLILDKGPQSMFLDFLRSVARFLPPPTHPATITIVLLDLLG